jgi:hypothetical protein
LILRVRRLVGKQYRFIKIFAILRNAMQYLAAVMVNATHVWRHIGALQASFCTQCVTSRVRHFVHLRRVHTEELSPHQTNAARCTNGWIRFQVITPSLGAREASRLPAVECRGAKQHRAERGCIVASELEVAIAIRTQEGQLLGHQVPTASQ